MSCRLEWILQSNHVMALLLEVADYSLNQLKSVPEEIACTSRLRQWGIPGVSSSIPKAPVIKTVVQKNISKKGISCTLYDPRNIAEPDEKALKRLQQMQNELFSRNRNIGFACCIPPIDVSDVMVTNTNHGPFMSASPLSYQLNPLGFDFEVETNIPKMDEVAE